MTDTDVKSSDKLIAIRAQQKEYNGGHTEEIKAWKKEHYEANKEDILANNKVYYEENKDMINKRNKDYLDCHKKYTLTPAVLLNWAKSMIKHKREYS